MPQKMRNKINRCQIPKAEGSLWEVWYSLIHGFIWQVFEVKRSQYTIHNSRHVNPELGNKR